MLVGHLAFKEDCVASETVGEDLLQPVSCLGRHVDWRAANKLNLVRKRATVNEKVTSMDGNDVQLYVRIQLVPA